MIHKIITTHRSFVLKPIVNRATLSPCVAFALYQSLQILTCRKKIVNFRTNYAIGKTINLKSLRNSSTYPSYCPTANYLIVAGAPVEGVVPVPAKKARGTANVDGNLLDRTRLVFEILPPRRLEEGHYRGQKSIISHSSPILPYARNRHSEAG